MNKSYNHRDQEHSLEVLNVLESNSASTQRELSQRVDVSLGKINFLLSSLINAGYIKAKKFKNSKNKMAYLYILTPKGLRQKAFLTKKFLDRKTQEYKELKREIEELRNRISFDKKG
ncbi:MAG: MarR family EPS-associated transcriptional regulator [Candidatus Aureabacteria bacterium]|nr:MarR family EPS-associated transcriptional regulator [Candidatus Auribacterota bacterium]